MGATFQSACDCMKLSMQLCFDIKLDAIKTACWYPTQQALEGGPKTCVVWCDKNDGVIMMMGRQVPFVLQKYVHQECWREGRGDTGESPPLGGFEGVTSMLTS